MLDDEDLIAGLRRVGDELDHRSPVLTATDVMAGQTARPFRRRRRSLVGGIIAVGVLAAGFIVWTRLDDGSPVRTAGHSDRSTTDGLGPANGSNAAERCGSGEVRGDVDGDGQSDRITHYWDAELGRALVKVCLADGLELTTPGSSQAEALQVVDIEPDGRVEILAGGTGATSAGYLVIAYIDGRLVQVKLVDDTLSVVEGATEQDDSGDTTQSAAFGCEDLAGDGTRELVQVTATFTSTGASWTKTGYSRSGPTASQVSLDQGHDALPADRVAYPKSLTSPCSPPEPNAPATQVCAPYLEYLGSGADRLADLAASLPAEVPAEVRTAIEHAQSDNFESTSLQTGEDIENLDFWVRQQCDQIYLAGVEARPGTDEAAQILFDAVVAGDREAAAKVAAANALAVFEPWGPVDEAPGAPTLSEVAGGTYRLQLTDGPDYVECEGWDGVIRGCRLIQPASLERADAPDSQAAGICAGITDSPAVTFTISLDAGVPAPRCAQVTPNQRLRITNDTAEDLTVSFGRLAATIPAGRTYTFTESFEQVYEPGHHNADVVSPTIDWRLEIILRT